MVRAGDLVPAGTMLVTPALGYETQRHTQHVKNATDDNSGATFLK